MGLFFTKTVQFFHLCIYNPVNTMRFIGSGVLFTPGLQIGPHCGTINRNIWRHGRTEVYMIVVIRKDTQEPAMRQLAVRLMNQGVRIGRTPGQDAPMC